jgi:hypothetical protein
MISYTNLKKGNSVFLSPISGSTKFDLLRIRNNHYEIDYDVLGKESKYQLTFEEEMSVFQFDNKSENIYNHIRVFDEEFKNKIQKLNKNKKIDFFTENIKKEIFRNNPKTNNKFYSSNQKSSLLMVEKIYDYKLEFDVNISEIINKIKVYKNENGIDLFIFQADGLLVDNEFNAENKEIAIKQRNIIIQEMNRISEELNISIIIFFSLFEFDKEKYTEPQIDDFEEIITIDRSDFNYFYFYRVAKAPNLYSSEKRYFLKSCKNEVTSIVELKYMRDYNKFKDLPYFKCKFE